MAGKSQTVTNKSEPWEPSQGFLREGLNSASDLYQSGGFASSPYQGQRVAGFGDTSQAGQNMAMTQAMGGAPLVDQAQSTLSGMMQGDQGIYRDLDAVKNEALGSAIPAATSMFSGSGMVNSSTAQDAVGRAAMNAVAPIEYAAFDNAQNRAMQAANMAPSITQAGYIPSAMMQSIGGAQDAMQQAQIDANMQRHYETEGQDAANFQAYQNALMGFSGQGGAVSETTPGANFGEKVGSAFTGGAGLYGALAGVPFAGPLAIMGGLAGLL